MEDRSKAVVLKGRGYAGPKGYPTLNVYMDINDGIYYCKVHVDKDIEYGLMSVINKNAEIHLLYAEDKDYYDMAVTVTDMKVIDKELIINAAMHLYGEDIIYRLGSQYE